MAAGVQLPRYFATVWLAATESLSCGRVEVDLGAEVATELADEAAFDDEAALLTEDAALDEELDDAAFELEDAALEDELEDFAAELEEAAFDDAAALLAALLDATLDELAETVGPTEHQALAAKLFDGNSEAWQVKLPVSVAYTKEPDLPSATVCVPLMAQAAPSCAHFL